MRDSFLLGPVNDALALRQGADDSAKSSLVDNSRVPLEVGVGVLVGGEATVDVLHQGINLVRGQGVDGRVDIRILDTSEDFSNKVRAFAL